MQKRFEMRRSARVNVEVFSPYWSSPMSLMSGDLSPRGLYVESELSVILNSPVICSFSFGRDYHLIGRVSRINRHRRTSDVGSPGFGVVFSQMRPLTRINLRSDLRGLPPPPPKRRREGFWLESTGTFITID